MTCPVKNYFNSIKDYYIEQINTSCLSQYAFYIESKGEAVIIDPIREINYYTELLSKRNAKLKYILETHFHADFVSGHVDLARKTGAEIVYGPTAKAGYNIKVASDCEKLKIGDIQIEVMHTPGHTMESSCFVLIDNKGKEKAIFTGDTVFLGEVGRPDLAVGGNISEKDLAGYLYDSIQKIKKLPEDVIIFPGHGAGSACGKNISSGSGDTLGSQKLKNYAFNDNLTKDEFINIATSNLPKPPQYFFHDVMLNKKGYDDLEELINKNLKGLQPDSFLKKATEDNTIILDTRDANQAMKSFIRGSIILPLNMNYAIWAATLFKPDTKFLLVTDKGNEREAMTRLARVGYNNTVGYLEGGIDLLTGKDLTSLQQVDDFSKLNLIDVRSEQEYENEGIIDHAKLFPLPTIFKNIDEIRNMKTPIGVYCKAGARSTIAGSILKKYNIDDVYAYGSFKKLVEKGAKVIKYIKH